MKELLLNREQTMRINFQYSMPLIVLNIINVQK